MVLEEAHTWRTGRTTKEQSDEEQRWMQQRRMLGVQRRIEKMNNLTKWNDLIEHWVVFNDLTKNKNDRWVYRDEQRRWTIWQSGTIWLNARWSSTIWRRTGTIWLNAGWSYLHKEELWMRGRRRSKTRVFQTQVL